MCATKRYVIRANGNVNVNGAIVKSAIGGSLLNFLLPVCALCSTLRVKAWALLALSMNASPVKPPYISAYRLKALVIDSTVPMHQAIPCKSDALKTLVPAPSNTVRIGIPMAAGKKVVKEDVKRAT